MICEFCGWIGCFLDGDSWDLGGIKGISLELGFGLRMLSDPWIAQMGCDFGTLWIVLLSH